jgi:hypothetical protein
MPAVASVNRTSGIYRSDCCHVIMAVPAFKRFPPCANRRSFSCKGPNAEWILVRRTSPVTEREILPDRAV